MMLSRNIQNKPIYRLLRGDHGELTNRLSKKHYLTHRPSMPWISSLTASSLAVKPIGRIAIHYTELIAGWKSRFRLESGAVESRTTCWLVVVYSYKWRQFPWSIHQPSVKTKSSSSETAAVVIKIIAEAYVNSNSNYELWYRKTVSVWSSNSIAV